MVGVHDILVFLHPLLTAEGDDVLVILGVPDSHPGTLHNGFALKAVLFDLFACQSFATDQRKQEDTLVQHGVGSDSTAIVIVILIGQIIFVRGNTPPVHVKLRSVLHYP